MGEAYQDEQDEKVSEAWMVTSLEECDWALSRIADLEAEQEENERIAAAAIQRIKDRLAGMNAKAERGVRFFSGKVQAFAERERDLLLKGGKKRSRELVHGVIGWRASRGGLKVTDEAKLLAWARAQPVESEVLRVKEEPALSVIGEHFERTGEVPDGMEPKEASEAFFVKAKGSVNEH